MSLKQFYDSISGNYEDAIERMTDEKFIQFRIHNKYFSIKIFKFIITKIN